MPKQFSLWHVYHYPLISSLERNKSVTLINYTGSLILSIASRLDNDFKKYYKNTKLNN
ncbi:hypothetical protein OENI_180006 [Oenococcus oeni]|nr:hypothetical protein OENI_180006 [Oenococcus oeni]SYW15805.1 hypothetical protein OENI_150028 [Oenococcus oeni]